MNTPQEINFAEARDTLSKLEAYVNQKIARKNASSLQDTAMNLAPQPEITSDNIGEEKPLSPVPEFQQQDTTSEQLEGTEKINEQTLPIETQTTSLVEENTVQQSPAMQNIPAGMGVSVDTNQLVSQFAENQPNPVMPGAPGLESQVMQNVPAGMGVSVDTNQLVSQFAENQPNPVMPGTPGLESPVMQNVPAGMGVAIDTNQPVSQFMANQQSPIMPSTSSGMGMETLASTEKLNLQLEEKLSQDSQQPSTSLENKSEEISSASEDEFKVPSLDSIPDIDLSGVLGEDSVSETSKSDESYKAMTNNATIGYPDATPPEVAPVIMPNGMTQDMNSSDSIVVGPEAFNMTR